jgi:hypothetical protein
VSGVFGSWLNRRPVRVGTIPYAEQDTRRFQKLGKQVFHIEPAEM